MSSTTRSRLQFRASQSEDSSEVIRLWRENHSDDFALPNPRPSFCNTVAEKDGKLIAYGMLVPHPEAIMLLDRSLPKREKVEVLKTFMGIAISGGREMQFQRLYTFTSSPSYADVLRKHFKMKNINQEGLILDFGGK